MKIKYILFTILAFPVFITPMELTWDPIPDGDDTFFSDFILSELNNDPEIIIESGIVITDKKRKSDELLQKSDETNTADQKKIKRQKRMQKEIECPTCHEFFPQKKYPLHENYENKAARYLCDICKLAFEKLKAKVNHNYNVHSKTKNTPSACGICKLTFATLRAKISHNFHVHVKDVDFTCSSCEYTTRNRKNLKRHEESPHAIYCCDSCPLHFKSYGALIQHSNVHPKVTVCQECGYEALTRQLAASHSKLIHKDLPCKINHGPNELCNKIYRSKGALRQHKQKFK